MKGGLFQKWCGNEDHLVNWWRDGDEIRCLGIEHGKVASRPQNMEYYFRPGVTWSHSSSRGLSVRRLPAGFICNVEGMAAYPMNDGCSIEMLLALLNSSLARYIIDVLNPTVHFGSREIGDLPYLSPDDATEQRLTKLVYQAECLTADTESERETSIRFIAPPDWEQGLSQLEHRQSELKTIEQQIDSEIYALAGLQKRDIQCIEADLNSQLRRNPAMFRNHQQKRRALAREWISYAVGVVLGRFVPGSEATPGRGRCSDAVNERLLELRVSDGWAFVQGGGDDDLTSRVFAALVLMVGDAEAASLVTCGCGKRVKPIHALRQWFRAGFFKSHLKRYRQRPVYCLLQSPAGRFAVLAHYPALSPDMLEDVRTRVNSADQLASSRVSAYDRERSPDRQAFCDAIQRVIRMSDDRGSRVGWQHASDDGVLVNLSPLHELMPGFRKDLEDCWHRLQTGEYDWSQTAMRYWPTRVYQQCRDVRSIALAHDRLDLHRSESAAS
jgi:hypothetical protein